MPLFSLYNSVHHLCYKKMRLSKFILLNLEQILTEWESCAVTVLPNAKFTKNLLRNSAEEILKSIAADMETAQTPLEQADKSKGRELPTEGDTAAESTLQSASGWTLIRPNYYRNTGLFGQLSLGSGGKVYLTWGTILTLCN